MDVFFNRDTVLFELDAREKWEVIERMLDALTAHGFCDGDTAHGREVLLAAVREREAQCVTDLGHGFAFPHGRVPGLPCTGLCVARLTRPVVFGAPGAEGVRIVALMLAPEEHSHVALKVMASFARLFSDRAKRELLFDLDDEALFAALVQERVLSDSRPVTARDIMRPPIVSVAPDTALKEVTRMMNQHMLESISVTDADGTLLGQITCDQLFKLGMPDFFTQLKSVSFIREFDPFEKYFQKETNALARDVMTADMATLPEEATLLEVVFELAVKRHPKIYVVREGKRVGVIDRSLVLDRVINI